MMRSRLVAAQVKSFLIMRLARSVGRFGLEVAIDGMASTAKLALYSLVGPAAGGEVGQLAGGFQILVPLTMAASTSQPRP